MARDPDPLLQESARLGTGEQIGPCGDPLRPAVPAPPAHGDAVGLTLSGGGFRATVAALGAVRALADAGLLASVRYVSSVSGGSIANGLLARHWPALRARGFTAAAVDALLIDPVVDRLSSRSLKWALVRNVWRAVGSADRTDVLAGRFDQWFFDGLLLQDLDPEVRWIVNAANLVTGVRFTFERDVVGDYVGGLAPTAGTGLSVAQASAASAAVPGAFAAWELKGVRFPCAPRQPVLLDGGAYDNTGSEALESDNYRDVFLTVLNVGGLLQPGGYGRIPLVRDLARSNALLYRQSTGLRTRMLVERFQAGAAAGPGPLPLGARRGVLVALATSFPDPGSQELQVWRAAFPEQRTWNGDDLSLYPTVFDRLPAGLCRALVYRGWWLIGAALAQYHPGSEIAPCTVSPPPRG